jgi:hypothetical protein
MHQEPSPLPEPWQRAADFANAINAHVLSWSEDTLAPVVTIVCATHGEVTCSRVYCSQCMRESSPAAFLLPVQAEPVGELVTTPLQTCTCGISHLRAICERCEASYPHSEGSSL